MSPSMATTLSCQVWNESSVLMHALSTAVQHGIQRPLCLLGSAWTSCTFTTASAVTCGNELQLSLSNPMICLLSAELQGSVELQAGSGLAVLRTNVTCFVKVGEEGLV